MSSNKLHPIYVALDSHQYSRAVKLASALPPSNLLGQALLAHALLKSGAVNKALIVIKSLLWFDSVELEYEIARLDIGSSSVEESSSKPQSTTKQSHHQPKSKKGSKNRKGSKTAAAAVTTPEPSVSSQEQKDLVEHLMSPLEFPPEWDQVAVKADKQVITDQVGATDSSVVHVTCNVYLLALYYIFTSPLSKHRRLSIHWPSRCKPQSVVRLNINSMHT